jgi:hypothetical protein
VEVEFIFPTREVLGRAANRRFKRIKVHLITESLVKRAGSRAGRSIIKPRRLFVAERGPVQRVGGNNKLLGVS